MPEEPQATMPEEPQAPEKPSTVEKHFDLIQKIRNEPVPAMIVVGFLVASAVIGLGLQVLNVYREAAREKREAMEERYKTQLELAIFRSAKSESDYQDLSARFQGVSKDNKDLSALQNASASVKEAKLLNSIDRLRQRLKAAENGSKNLRQENDQLKLKIAQLQLPSPDASDAERELASLRQKISSLEGKLAQHIPREVDLALALKEIHILDDGTSGDTKWDFQVFANEDRILSLQQEDYSDRRSPIRIDGPSLRLSVKEGSLVNLRVSGHGPQGRSTRGQHSLFVRKRSEREQTQILKIPVMVKDNPREGTFIFTFHISL